MTTKDPKKFYNEIMPEKFGDDYEYKRWHETPIKEVGFEQTTEAIHRALQNVSATSILELGPGAGTWTRVLVKHFPNASLTLVDISKEMLARAKSVVGEQNKVFVESNILDFQPVRGYEFFFSSRVLEYIPDKNAFALKLASLLVPGGNGVLITKMPHYAREKLLKRESSTFHKGQIPPAELKAIFTSAGLCVDGIFPATVSVPLFSSPRINKYIGKFLSSFQINSCSSFFTESYIVRFHRL